MWMHLMQVIGNSSQLDDPATARSRMGYVINFADCPMVWASKLQTEIALSTTEVEYIALSTSTGDIPPYFVFSQRSIWT